MTDLGQLQRVRDEEHLKLLSIFYYISGALTALFALIPVIHMTVGLIMLVASRTAMSADERAPLAFFGLAMVFIGGGIVVFGELIAALKLYTGHCLAQRKNRTLCLVVGGVSCLAFPYGTVLGVFTFIVLLRDSVRDLFEGAEQPAPE